MGEKRYRKAQLALLRDALVAEPGLAKESGTVWLAVRGWCMEPLLRDGDRVEIEPLDGPPRVGQLVLAREGDEALVCHRILAWHDDRGLLAGDRSQRLERHGRDDVFGRLVAVERDGHRLELPSPTRLDAFMARWHHAAQRRRGSFVGRWLDALRRRIVAARAHRWWRERAAGAPSRR